MAAINKKAQATVLGLVSLAFAFPVQANAYSNDDLVYMVRAEEKAFGHADLKMSLDQRLDALETSVIGSKQGGSSSQRLRRVMEKLGMVAPSAQATSKIESKKSPVSKKSARVKLASKQKRLIATKRQSRSYSAPVATAVETVQEQTAPSVPQEQLAPSSQTEASVQETNIAPSPVVIVLMGAVGAIVLGCLGIVIYLFMRVKDETVTYARETNEVLIARRRSYTNESEDLEVEESTGFQPVAEEPVYTQASFATESEIEGNAPSTPGLAQVAATESPNYPPAFEIFDEGYADFAVEYKAADAIKEIVERFSAEPEMTVEIVERFSAEPEVAVEIPQTAQVPAVAMVAPIPPVPPAMPECAQTSSGSALPAMVAAPPRVNADQMYTLGTSEKEASRKIELMLADSEVASNGFASWMRRVVDAAHSSAEDTASSVHINSFVPPAVSHSFLEQESSHETSYTIYAMPPENMEVEEKAPPQSPALSIPYGDEEYNSDLYDTYTNLSVTEFFWSDMPPSRQEPLMTENSYKSSTLISTEEFLAGLLEQTPENEQDSPSTTADSPTGLVDQCDFVAKYAHPNSCTINDAFAALNAVLAPAYKVENTMDNQHTLTYQAAAYDIDFASNNVEPPTAILTVSEVRSRKTSEIDVQQLAAQYVAASSYQDEGDDDESEGDEEGDLEEEDDDEGDEDGDLEDDDESEGDGEDEFEDDEEIAKSTHEVEWTSNEYAELAKQLIQCLSGICEAASENKPRAGRRTLQKLAVRNSIGKQTFTNTTKIVSADFDIQLRNLFSSKESA